MTALGIRDHSVDGTGHRLLLFCVGFVALTLSWVPFASAQDAPAKSFVSDIFKSVVLDPTTYAPAAVFYGATRLDWQSSQVFFEHGYVEHNSRYTLSGVGDSAAIGHGVGNRKIVSDSLGVLRMSILHNVTERVIERALTRRYPNHQKVVRIVGMVERIVGASVLSIVMSGGHARQWQANERLARQLGFK